MKAVRHWPIIRTIAGKNGAGKKLHKILPFKAQRERVGAVVSGILDLSPIPNDKSATIEEKAATIYGITKSLPVDLAEDQAIETIQSIKDILDDGLINDSAEISAQERATIRKVTSWLVWLLLAYEGLAVLMGWPSIMNYALIIFGL